MNVNKKRSLACEQYITIIVLNLEAQRVKTDNNGVNNDVIFKRQNL